MIVFHFFHYLDIPNPAISKILSMDLWVNRVQSWNLLKTATWWFSSSGFSSWLFSPAVSAPRLFSPKTFQLQDFSAPRLFSPKMFQPQDFSAPNFFSSRLFSPKTFQLQDFSAPRLFSPKTFQPRMFQTLLIFTKNWEKRDFDWKICEKWQYFSKKITN